MFKHRAIKNSFWAIASMVFQNIIFSIFFIIIARAYQPEIFSSYIISNTIYGLLLSFSSLGMAQWYIRSDKGENDHAKAQLFLNIQLMAGFVFYLLNVIIAFLLYQEPVIHAMSLILGINIVFDNMIYVYKTINTANFQQQQTFLISSIEALLKLCLGVLVYQIEPNILLVALVLTVLRCLSMVSFYSLGTIKLQFNFLQSFNISTIKQIFSTMYVNRYFLFIGTISVLFWSIGGILVSKFLTPKDVAQYEISFKLFAMAEIIPVMVLSTLFPLIIQRINEPSKENHDFFKLLSLGSFIYGLFSYTFVLSFSQDFIPLLFGEQYVDTHIYCTEMFLTMTIFPSVLYQANLLVAIHMEKTDMYLNLLSLIVNVLIAGFGLYYTYSLSAIMYSIFIAFVIFHLSQEFFLIKKGIKDLIDIIRGYMFVLLGISVYAFLMKYISPYFLYPLLWGSLLIALLPILKKQFAKA